MFGFIKKKVDPPIDYVGQELASNLLNIMFIIGYGLSIIVGYLLQDLKYTLIITVITIVTCFLTVVPAWPFYRRNPLMFVRVKNE